MELKFRAWDGNGFTYSDEYERSGLTPNEALSEFFSDCYACEIQQFAGFSDSDGKAIYEGDIIEADEKERATVSYQSGMYRAHSTKFRTQTYSLAFYTNTDMWKRIQVVGNIYESQGAHVAP